MFFDKKKKSKNTNNNSKPKNFEFSFLSNEVDKNTNFDTTKENTEKNKQSKLKTSFISIIKIVYIVFVIICIYFIFSFIRVKINHNNKIDIYEINTGEIIKYNKENGVIYRDEEVYTANENGYINYFSLSNSRVSKDSLIYIINDNNEYNAEKNELKDSDYDIILYNLKNYINNFNNLNFQNVYNYTNSLNTIIKELNIIDNLSNIQNNNEIKVKSVGYAKHSGIISYYIDGYETKSDMDFNERLIVSRDTMDKTNQGNVVNKGDSIFKIITNPDYEIVFKSNNNYDYIKDGDSVKIKFTYDDLYADAKLYRFIGNDNKNYYKIVLNKYLERYLDRRVVEFEIVSNSKSGYKIPNSTITAKNCYRIPKSYLITDEFDEDIFYKVDKDSNVQKLNVNISKIDNDYCYISTEDAKNSFSYGDVLTDNQNNFFNLKDVVKLKGVYNINKGYAIFKNIDILDETNEYTIIDKSTIRGVSLYDRIALNANKVKEGDLIS